RMSARVSRYAPRSRCCPLSSNAPRYSTRRARPPPTRLASIKVTDAPDAASSTAAARPAYPAPTTPTLTDGLSCGPRPRLPRDPELAQRRERDALLEHAEAVTAD